MQGHWCAAIGHVPVMVKGAIGCNELIVASLDHPPMGQPLTDVTDSSARQRVVAFTLQAKETEAPATVMAFALFALASVTELIKVRLQRQVGMNAMH